jgi:hypothetical protein
VEAHRDEFDKGEKSRRLNFGVVGFRQSTKILIKRVQETLQKLKERGMLDCIIVKESPSKERLREYPDEILAEVGCKRVVEDTFFADIDRERVRAAAMEG